MKKTVVIRSSIVLAVVLGVAAPAAVAGTINQAPTPTQRIQLITSVGNAGGAGLQP